MKEVNYSKKLLDIIYKRCDLDILNQIYDLVKDKILLKRFVDLLLFCSCFDRDYWLKQIIEEMLSKPEIEITSFENSLLIYSCKVGRLDVVKYLVSNNIDIHREDGVELENKEKRILIISIFLEKYNHEEKCCARLESDIKFYKRFGYMVRSEYCYLFHFCKSWNQNDIADYLEDL